LETPHRLASRSRRAAVAGSKATLVRTVMAGRVWPRYAHNVAIQDRRCGASPYPELERGNQREMGQVTPNSSAAKVPLRPPR
jgi:hypothetical protein